DWKVEDFVETLDTGMTPDSDKVGGAMVEVVSNTSQLSAADREAMAVYLKSLPPVEGTAAKKKAGPELLGEGGTFLLIVGMHGGGIAILPMHPVKAIGLKLLSALLFAAMSALVRQLGDVAPVGQMVFFRSAFAILPVVVIYAIRGELSSAVRTSRPLGQLGRGSLSVCGMFSNFSALTPL